MFLKDHFHSKNFSSYFFHLLIYLQQQSEEGWRFSANAALML